MANIKVYKNSNRNNHQLIKALNAKGYSEITITWYPATERFRGYAAETKETGWIKLGPCINTSLKTINDLKSCTE